MQEKLENCIAVDDFRIMMIDLWEFLLLLFIKRIAYYFSKKYEIYCTFEFVNCSYILIIFLGNSGPELGHHKKEKLT